MAGTSNVFGTDARPATGRRAGRLIIWSVVPEARQRIFYSDYPTTAAASAAALLLLLLLLLVVLVATATNNLNLQRSPSWQQRILDRSQNSPEK